MSLFSGRSMNRIGVLGPPTCNQLLISPRKIRANSSAVRLLGYGVWINGLSGPTIMAIFSRLISTPTNPWAASSGVTGRPIAARSTEPSRTAFRAASALISLISTLVSGYSASNPTFNLWVITLMLGELAMLTVIPSLTVSRRGNASASAAVS